jgi:polar amino acid transport system ATP-binding protein/sulfate transport system ATP-binding protein/NitT/TauT family transport system ATP-binding protein
MDYERKETLLKVENVSIKLGGKQVLRDINFEIKDIIRPGVVTGQIVGLVGKSGVGKSTMLNILAGLETPSAGKISQGDSLLPVQPGDMGVVYQDYYLYNWRKVRTILKFTALKNQAIKAADANDAIQGIANDFDITDHLDKYPSQLSGGQQQRVAIAEQILGGSEFLLLDEPFSGLDMITIDKVIEILLKVSCYDEKKTIIVVSHDLSNTIALADTIYVLSKQKGQEGGTIVKQIDLIERGLAWHTNIKETAEFRDTIKEIKQLL